MSGKNLEIVELGRAVRQKDSRFSEDTEIDELVAELLRQHLGEIGGENSPAAREKRAELRDSMDLDGGSSQSDGLDDAAKRQQELRDRMGLGDD